MLTQVKVDELIALAKVAVRDEVFTWLHNTRQEELLVSTQDRELQFLLSLKRNPFEITAQLRTRDRHFPLARIDNAVQHINPDGNVLRGPHIHWYREGYGMAWAERANWYALDRPLETLLTFLDLIAARFPNGMQEALL
ncbi:hypothetical protein [Metallibacterium sp.]|uniref:DUF6978 family protein n=1 Tax=Metallibacterium sp. TaxID=2940281 RepID=UPI002636C58C|nr:hypothetical protein [Metallibacterium sp.]